MNAKKEDELDDELVSFIRVILTNHYAMKSDVSSKGKDEALEYLLGTSTAKKDKEYYDIINFDKYKEINALSEEGILYFIDAFDSLANGNKGIKVYLPDNYRFYFDEIKGFENALKHEFESNHQRLCFHAYIRFLIFNQNDQSGIDQWMRVIHNLSHPENTTIVSVIDLAVIIKSIEELLPYSNDILSYLKEKETDISVFSSWQILEEKIKAHLISKNDKWKSLIEMTEKHRYFNGQIGFILEFAGITNYYKNNYHCDWNEKENETYFRRFTDYAIKAGKVFEESYQNRVNDKDYVFERAVLTKGDYLTHASQNRKNLLSTNLTKNNIKRDHSWKRLLRLSEDKDWMQRRLFVKQVFDDTRFDSNNLISSLDAICKDRTNTWRDYFISSPAMIDYCNQGFIRFENENYILLHGQSQSNSYNAELYTYYFWKEFIEPQKDKFKSFFIDYNSFKGIKNKAFVLLSNFATWGNMLHYDITIFFRNNYEIVFKLSLGKSFINYGQDLKNILAHHNFVWNDQHEGYYATSNDVYS
ncbi:MAG: hypothetical protein U5L09_01800 [Bacteroidales bacterium]|nr:hypothetical protein [Bacteroidales bacterium]